MRRRGLPIGVLSFNRPDYLEQVLTSLSAQLVPDDHCYLFQDGAWNPCSGETRAQEAELWRCVEVFSRLIPAGRVFASPMNLGVAGNYRRAEAYIFQYLRSQEAVFLEDDLVLSPDFMRVTVDLLARIQLRNA
jgi:GT2 family glycosyltransferase